MHVTFSFFTSISYSRFNAIYAQQMYDYSPVNVDASIKNSLRHRGLEGFIAAISPFNFTAIGGNLAYTPVLMVCKTKSFQRS